MRPIVRWRSCWFARVLPKRYLRSARRSFATQRLKDLYRVRLLDTSRARQKDGKYHDQHGSPAARRHFREASAAGMRHGQSLVSEGHHGIDSRSPLCRHVGGEHRDQKKQPGYSDE
jgi:hypothetical protein